MSEIEQVREGLASGQSGVGVSQFIEVGVKESSEGSGSSLWVIDKESRDKINGFLRSSRSENLFPGKGLDLGESVFLVVRIHGNYIFPRRGS